MSDQIDKALKEAKSILFTISLETELFTFNFIIKRYIREIFIKGKKTFPEIEKIECNIYYKGEEDSKKYRFLTEGFCIRDTRDEFNLNEGLKIALKKAIKSISDKQFKSKIEYNFKSNPLIKYLKKGII